jgi:C4-dicarboxylate transporter, DctQ subunit
MSLATHNGEDMSGERSEHIASGSPGSAAPRGALFRLSAAIATGESVAAGIAAATTFSLLVVNIVTRSAGQAVYWTDETAILAMVWMAFLAASLTIHYRSHIAVTLVTDMLRPRVRLVFAVLVDTIMLTLMIVIGILVWNWFDPVGLYLADWDIAEFASTTFNFMYEEPTMTIGIQKAWFWLIMPWFVIAASIHCLSNLAGSVGEFRASGRPA